MSELRFDGRVVVVTGAGRGLGRAYAHLLAERGAQVVVNDLGVAVDGSGSDPSAAVEVVAEIEAAGGTAVADTSDVSAADGAEALVRTAVDAFGRLDAVVNNAGIVRWGALPDLTDEDLDAILAVHVGGSVKVTRAAWPHLARAGEGRVVMTTSAGVFGLGNNTSYAAAKGAVLGLTRSLALAGAEHGIKVNAVAPAAATRMGGDTREAALAPALAAPMVAYLAHEDCPVSGEVYAAGMGRFARLFLAQGPGYIHDGGPPTPEDVGEHWSAINAEEGYWVPPDLVAWSIRFTARPR